MSTIKKPTPPPVVPIPPAPTNHFDLGKILGLALLGLQAYSAQDQPGAGPKIFLDPNVTAQLMAGVLSILHTAPAVPPVAGQ